MLNVNTSHKLAGLDPETDESSPSPSQGAIDFSKLLPAPKPSLAIASQVAQPPALPGG